MVFDWAPKSTYSMGMKVINTIAWVQQHPKGGYYDQYKGLEVQIGPLPAYDWPEGKKIQVTVILQENQENQ